MEPRRYTRQQVAHLLGVDEAFIVSLEEESIIEPLGDAPPEEICFSAEACEQIRVAHQLVRELEVNLAGTAIILRLRQQLESIRQQFHATLSLIREAALMAERRRGGR